MGIDKINTNNRIYDKPSVKKVEAVSGTNAEVTESRKVEAPAAKETTKPAPKEARKPVVKRSDDQASATERIEEQTRENIENVKRVKNAIAEVNKKMNQKTHCEFSYHEDTKRVSIKVIDSDTQEVIREIPPEETLNMLTKMWEVAGILVDEQR